MGKSQKMTVTGQTQPGGRGQHDDQGSRQVQAVGTGTELRISWSERDLYWANTARPKAGMEGSLSFARKLRSHLEELLDVKPSSLEFPVVLRGIFSSFSSAQNLAFKFKMSVVSDCCLMRKITILSALFTQKSYHLCSRSP